MYFTWLCFHNFYHQTIDNSDLMISSFNFDTSYFLIRKSLLFCKNVKVRTNNASIEQKRTTKIRKWSELEECKNDNLYFVLDFVIYHVNNCHRNSSKCRKLHVSLYKAWNIDLFFKNIIYNFLLIFYSKTVFVVFNVLQRLICYMNTKWILNLCLNSKIYFW